MISIGQLAVFHKCDAGPLHEVESTIVLGVDLLQGCNNIAFFSNSL